MPSASNSDPRVSCHVRAPRCAHMACRIRVVDFLLLFGLSVVTTTTGCGDDAGSESDPCVVGDSQICAGVGNCVGESQCLNSGTWGECNCPTRAQELRNLGGACSGDGGCPTGATCLLPSSSAWFGGGPPQGLCVADCSEGVEACSAFANAVCVAANREGSLDAPTAWCMPSCDLSAGTSA